MKATRQYIDGIATAIAETSNIKLVEGKTWVTDIRKKVITYNPQDLLDTDAITAKGLILHEVAHANYTGESPITTIQKAHPVMQEFYNIYEDMRIEEKLKSDYGDYAEQALTATNEEGLTRIAEAIKNPNLTPLQKVQAGIMSKNINRYDLRTRKIENLLTYDENKIVYKSLDLHIAYKAIKTNSVAEVKKIVDDELYPLIKDLLPDHEEKQKTQGKGKQSITKHNAKERLEDKKTGRGYGEKNEHILPNDKELDQLLQPYINTVASRLKDILKEKEATRFQGNHLSGKLLSKNAYKVITGDERIFSRKNEPNKPNYVVTIVLDESGSMRNGTKHAYTYTSAVLLEEVCKRLNFKTNIVIYNDTIRGKETNYYSYEKNIQIPESVRAYRTIRGGGNNDAMAMDEVIEKISKHDDNIVFILTDGGICNDPRPQLAELRTKKNTRPIAIGIGLSQADSKNLKEYYTDTIEAKKPEDLPQVIINQLGRFIHR